MLPRFSPTCRHGEVRVGEGHALLERRPERVDRPRGPAPSRTSRRTPRARRPSSPPPTPPSPSPSSATPPARRPTPRSPARGSSPAPGTPRRPARSTAPRRDRLLRRRKRRHRLLRVHLVVDRRVRLRVRGTPRSPPAPCPRCPGSRRRRRDRTRAAPRAAPRYCWFAGLAASTSMTSIVTSASFHFSAFTCSFIFRKSSGTALRPRRPTPRARKSDLHTIALHGCPLLNPALLRLLLRRGQASSGCPTSRCRTLDAVALLRDEDGVHLEVRRRPSAGAPSGSARPPGSSLSDSAACVPGPVNWSSVVASCDRSDPSAPAGLLRLSGVLLRLRFARSASWSPTEDIARVSSSCRPRRSSRLRPPYVGGPSSTNTMPAVRHAAALLALVVHGEVRVGKGHALLEASAGSVWSSSRSRAFQNFVDERRAVLVRRRRRPPRLLRVRHQPHHRPVAPRRASTGSLLFAGAWNSAYARAIDGPPDAIAFCAAANAATAFFEYILSSIAGVRLRVAETPRSPPAPCRRCRGSPRRRPR